METSRSGDDEREGYFYLFHGAMIGNSKAHEFSRGDDPTEALGILALASLFHRRRARRRSGCVGPVASCWELLDVGG